MKISSLKRDKTVVSFEIFPPKKDGDLQSVYDTAQALSVLKPDFMSVTYGAAGSATNNFTAEISAYIKGNLGTEPLAHLTCSHLSKSDTDRITADFKNKNIENILALRGDAVPEKKGAYIYAKDLITDLKARGFCVGAAAYPEAHIECEDINLELEYLKQKENAGADFFITQLFFDNDIFLSFIDKAKSFGISKPVYAGIMPILSASQIERMVFMCGASLPSRIIKLVNKYGGSGEDLVKAGVEYSVSQMRGLIDKGVDGIHIYTMNKPFVARHCVNSIFGETVR